MITTNIKDYLQMKVDAPAFQMESMPNRWYKAHLEGTMNTNNSTSRCNGCAAQFDEVLCARLPYCGPSTNETPVIFVEVIKF